MAGYLARANSISEIESNEDIMAALGKAMYQIRAPQKSTRIGYEGLSIGQKIANQEKAIEILRASLPTSPRDPDETIENIARHLYCQLAPQKSQLEPWETRSEYHHAWYVTQATSFVMLVQQSLQLPGSKSSQSNESTLSDKSSPTVFAQAKVLAGNEQSETLRSIPASSERLEVLQKQSGERLDQLGDELLEFEIGEGNHTNIVTTELKNTSTRASIDSGTDNSQLTGPLYLIAFLLLVLILAVIFF